MVTSGWSPTAKQVWDKESAAEEAALVEMARFVIGPVSRGLPAGLPQDPSFLYQMGDPYVPTLPRCLLLGLWDCGTWEGAMDTG